MKFTICVGIHIHWRRMRDQKEGSFRKPDRALGNKSCNSTSLALKFPNCKTWRPGGGHTASSCNITFFSNATIQKMFSCSIWGFLKIQCSCAPWSEEDSSPWVVLQIGGAAAGDSRSSWWNESGRTTSKVFVRGFVELVGEWASIQWCNIYSRRAACVCTQMCVSSSQSFFQNDLLWQCTTDADVGWWSSASSSCRDSPSNHNHNCSSSYSCSPAGRHSCGHCGTRCVHALAAVSVQWHSFFLATKSCLLPQVLQGEGLLAHSL